MIYTNFSIFKNNYKKTDAQPDYKISAKVDDKFIEIGACWAKTDKAGNKFLSCKLTENPAPALSPEESEKIKQLKQAEIDRVNGELNIIAEEQFNDF